MSTEPGIAFSFLWTTLCSMQVLHRRSGAPLEDWRGVREACHSAICAPVFINGVALGSLNLRSPQPHAFSG